MQAGEESLPEFLEYRPQAASRPEVPDPPHRSRLPGRRHAAARAGARGGASPRRRQARGRGRGRGRGRSSGTYGILGGAFDPPHVGHVALARAAIEELDLERLLVLVVADPGHKETVDACRAAPRAHAPGVRGPGRGGDRARSPRAHRRLARGASARRRGFHRRRRRVRRLLAMEEPERILELVRLGVAMRPGVPDDRVREARARGSRRPTASRTSTLEPFRFPRREFASASRAGEPIDEFVPPTVAEAIARLGLYAAAE